MKELSIIASNAVNTHFMNFETSISQTREAISNAQMNSKGTEINRTREEMVLLKNVIQSFNQLKKAIKDWEYQYVLQSKTNGKVAFLNYWNTNQTVSQGDLVFTIIPSENSSFIAKLKSPVQNSGKIKVLVHSIAKGSLKPMQSDFRSTLDHQDFALTLNAMALSLYDWVKALFDKNMFADDARVVSFTSEGNTKAWPGYAAVAAARFPRTTCSDR